MMRIVTILFLPFFLALQPACAQQDSVFAFIKTIKGSFSSFTVDNLDNIYLISEGNQLKKLNANGDSAGVFNDVRRYGKLYSLDVTNPLKLLLYYKNFSTIVSLDRFLNSRNSIDLRKQNMFRVKAVGMAYDNNMWVVDEQEFKLKKIDEQGKTIFETVDWRQLFDTVPSPDCIFDREGYVYLYDSKKGFYIFDYYGAFKTRLPFTGWASTEVSGNTAYGFAHKKLYSYRQSSLTLKEYPLPDFFGKYSDIRAINGKLYLLKKEGIDVYLVK
jgi:hypothetical protein